MMDIIFIGLQFFWGSFLGLLLFCVLSVEGIHIRGDLC